MHAFKNRTDYCGTLSLKDEGRQVQLYGWVHRVRDLGGFAFIQLRDRHGIVQVVFEPDSTCLQEAGKVSAEWVVSIEGTVRKESSQRH